MCLTVGMAVRVIMGVACFAWMADREVAQQSPEVSK